MLYEMAIADAVSIPWEFVTEDEAKSLGDLKIAGFKTHPKAAEIGQIPGKYTDDTQRAIANAEVLLRDESFLPDSYIEAYLKAYKRDPRGGYSRKYKAFLDKVNNTLSWHTQMRPTRATNGCIMGIAPLGYLKTITEVKQAAWAQASVTHSSRALIYAEAVALMSWFFVHEKGVNRFVLPSFLDEFAPLADDGSISWKDLTQFVHPSVTMDAKTTCEAVLANLMSESSYMGLINNAIAMGGDTDSVAAISVGIASACSEYKNDFPQALEDGLENKAFGKTFLINLDQDLKTKFLK